VDDYNGLFYNFNRFYDPRVGRYTQADPIGLEGGWNRFGYVGGIRWGLLTRSD
jgi:RHS repeat-associated protein